LIRKSVLERILKTSNNIRYSEHIIGEGERLFHEVAKIPLEGIVAKRIDSPYVQKRSSDWLKVKTIQEMEVVIGGLPSRGNPGSILVLWWSVYIRAKNCITLLMWAVV